MKKLYKEDRIIFYVYFIVQVVAGLLILYSVFLWATNTSLPFADKEFFLFINALQLLLFPYLPIVFEKMFKAKVPKVLYWMNILFVLMTAGVGELAGVYAQTSWWDKTMHLWSGGILTLIGFSLVNLMNQPGASKKLNPFFITLFAFSFTMMIGVIWEIFEYGVDALVGSNMQRYRDSITGIPYVGQRALWDTMWDLTTNTIGSIVVSIYGYMALKNPQGKKFNQIIIQPISNE